MADINPDIRFGDNPFFHRPFKCNIEIGTYVIYEDNDNMKVGQIAYEVGKHSVLIVEMHPFESSTAAATNHRIETGFGKSIPELVKSTQPTTTIPKSSIREFAFVLSLRFLDNHSAVLQGMKNVFL